MTELSDAPDPPASGREKRRAFTAAILAARKGGFRAEALRLAEALVADAPGDLKAQVALVECLTEAGDRRAFAAIQALEGTQRERPGLRAGLLGLALRTGDDEEAARQLAVLRARPAVAREMKLAMKALDRHGRAAEAAEFRARLAEAILDERFTARLVRAIAAARPDRGARYVVNIGAHDGHSWGDPCFELFEGGWAGIALDAGAYPAIHRNLPQPAVVKLMETFATPDTIAGVLAAAGCPPEFDLLKIDIDSFDGPILAAVLREFRPSVIHIEVNPEIPPPIAFAIAYDERYVHSGFGGFSGCSVSYVTGLCRPRGYELVRLDLANPPVRQDAILVRADLRPAAFPSVLDERADFLRQPGLIGGFGDIGIDSRRWRAIADPRALAAEIREALGAASIARSGRVLPFHLAIARD